jgi:hypothetical protein
MILTVRAFYYLRALENPTCRWSTWDALRTGVEPRPGFAHDASGACLEFTHLGAMS